jgi:hypothetical protein
MFYEREKDLNVQVTEFIRVLEIIIQFSIRH